MTSFDAPRADDRLLAIAPWLAHPQAIRAVLLDVGFTLLQPNPSIAAVIARVCRREGIAASEDDLAARLPDAEERFAGASHLARGTWADNAAITAAWNEYFSGILRPFVKGARLRRAVAEILAEFDRHTAWQLYDDVLPALAALRGRFTLGVISDWGVALGAILRDLRLTGYFDVLVVSATSRRAKPDPHLFHTALERADAIGDYTVYVGDSYLQDILGARAAGIHPILIDRQRRLDALALDCPVIASLAELVGMLGIT